MKLNRIRFFSVLLSIMLLLTACGTVPAEASSSSETSAIIEEEPVPGKIYLYGEIHANPKHYAKELELWQELYADGVRHLFVESSYYTAQYLNLWMDAADDAILDQLFDDWSGTKSDNVHKRKFLLNIKETCPETIFHGTDVGHQFYTTGERYLQYLEDSGRKDSTEYELTVEAIKQGSDFYNGAEADDHDYRENTMTENFIREYETIFGEDIMGIYGAAHTDPEGLAFYTEIDTPCMANQLAEVYGEHLICDTVLNRIMKD